MMEQDEEQGMEGMRSSRQCGMDIYEPSLCYVYMDMRTHRAYIKIFRSNFVVKYVASEKKMWNGGQKANVVVQ
jgi:hypothetical protein